MRRFHWGVGPQIGLVTAAWAGLALVGHWAFYPTFAVPGGLRLAFRACGLGLLGVGIPVYTVVAIHFGRRVRRKTLVTTGPYAYVRHPLYAVGIFLLAPGAVLLVGSWLLLSVPPVMYLAARVFIPREEAALAQHYGASFRQYRRRTGRFVPRISSRRTRNRARADALRRERRQE